MDCDNFKDIVSKDEVLLIISSTLKTSHFHLEEYKIKPASEHPLGFLGVHAKIEAKATVGGGESKNLQYFLKKVPTAVPQHLEYALKTRAFYKEIELYKTLFVDLKEAQKNRGTCTKWCPEYYYSRNEELFVIEDLSVSGHYMLPEKTLMDLDHVKASLATMAAMHAASIVFEEKFNMGEIETRSPHFRKSGDGRVTLGEIYPHLTFETEASDVPGHPGNTYYEAGIKSQLAIVDLLPGYSQQQKEIIKSQLRDILRRLMQLVKPSSKYRNVFLHGDPWSNNLLFRKEKDGRITASLVDFQLARYAPPAHDVVLLLHLVQTDQFRRSHESAALEFYYQKLSDELARNDLSAAQLLPEKTFLESYREYYDLGLISSILYFQLILTPSEITSEFLSSTELFMKNMMVDRSEMITECFKKDLSFRTRMTQAMNDLISRFIPC